MSKLCLTKDERKAISAARSSYEKKSAWAGARYRLGIPSGVKLGVETSDKGAALYVKGSSPRAYLFDAGTGRYAYTGQVEREAAIGTATATPVNGGRFVAVDGAGDNSDWRSIDRSTLLDLLRDAGEDDSAILPQGFPAGLGQDAVVLDAANGTLYFRSND